MYLYIYFSIITNFHKYIQFEYTKYTVNCTNCNGLYLPSHLLGSTHSLFVTSMTVPAGHSHPLITQISGQGIGPVLLHVRWQLGCEAHSFLICPLMGQAAIKHMIHHLCSKM